MKVSVTKREDQKTTSWSGGLTTELWLWPETGSYAERNFVARISSATVEIEQSTFTTLLGVNRQIMTLSGDLKLTHENQKPILLKPYEVHAFSGETPTTSEGLVTDFNLMMKSGAEGFLDSVFLEAGQGGKRLDLSARENENFHLFYCALGTCEYAIGEFSGCLMQGDAIQIWKDANEGISIWWSSVQGATLARASVSVLIES